MKTTFLRLATGIFLIGIFTFAISKKDEDSKKIEACEVYADTCFTSINFKNQSNSTISVSAAGADQSNGPTPLVSGGSVSWGYTLIGTAPFNNTITICIQVTSSPHAAGRYKITGPGGFSLCFNIPANNTLMQCYELTACNGTYLIEYKEVTCPN